MSRVSVFAAVAEVFSTRRECMRRRGELTEARNVATQRPTYLLSPEARLQLLTILRFLAAVDGRRRLPTELRDK